MKCLYVLFDAECELCVRCRNWLAQQPAFVPLVFIAFQSEEAERRFPGFGALKPGEQLLLISDEGAVYRGAHEIVLSNGSVPLDVLEELVDRWIKSKQAA